MHVAPQYLAYGKLAGKSCIQHIYKPLLFASVVFCSQLYLTYASQRASFAQDLEPAPYRPTRKYARVEGSASAVIGTEGAFVDAGLAFGRSFRVGWGPGGTLIHLGALCGPQSAPTNSANTSVLHKTVVPLEVGSLAEVNERASKLLTHHLSSSPIEADADGVPFANPSKRLTFSSFAALFPATDRTFEACLFRLGRALFDPIHLRLEEPIGADIRNRVYALRRKAALSSWLQNAVAASVDSDLRENPGADWGFSIFALLSGNQVEKACEIAMDSGNVKLATLISQCPGDDVFRDDVRTQLHAWLRDHVDAHITESTRRIYALLGGIVDTLEGSKDPGPDRCPDISIPKGLNWRRAFGLHLWYGEPLESTVADAFQAYEQHWKNTQGNVASPLPWYMEQPDSDASLAPWKRASTANPPDALYSLIRLYADPACSLSTVLTPLSFSASPADYRLPWHLYILMSRCLRVRDFADRGNAGLTMGEDASDASEDGEPPVEGHSPSADLLANSYALQLEQQGLIQEAAFVLLHIEGSAGRVKAIKELLGRSAALLDDWMTRGLVGSLKLPLAWVNEAKAMHALDCGDVFGAYELYLSAGLYNAAHDLAVLELAPDAVIRGDLELLKGLFEQFLDHPVDDWHARGKVFLDYAHAMLRLEELGDYLEDTNSAVPDAAEAADLEHLSRSVPRLISMLPDVLHDQSDVRHKAAVAEMTTQLTTRLDRVRPLALNQSPVRNALLDDGLRIHNIRTAAYERFLKLLKLHDNVYYVLWDCWIAVHA
ncbi:nuclear protein 96-domain-containing protein [Fomitopsis serialis]|uniref:nuclear protein 96-domain-containing protein n=1 Tax=Fomitopsis serialis TaxID=139415 RepID=UPI00200756CF|nr:nuclear protein 96-domain-containing protein [Neoantrodia serialis]KAH9933052.1 nuclear protein 96-domain-containing protein [Neoantrodia serialis]